MAIIFNRMINRRLAFWMMIWMMIGIACTPSDEMELVRNGKSDFYLAPADGDSTALLAAYEIHHFIFEMTKVELAINPVDTKGLKKIILTGNPILSDSLSSKLKALKEDGFLKIVSQDSILIAGTDSTTTLYAAYQFLKEMGCMLFPDGEEYCPKTNHIHLKKEVKFYEPDFSHRQTSLYRLGDQRYQTWNRTERQDKIFGMFVHTFTHLISPAIYFEKHPEWFAYFNGKRNYESQLCLSNDEMTAEMIKNLGARMAAQPNKKFWSVSQNDYFNYCECEKCQEKYQKYGSYSGAYIEFVNKIAAAYPEKQISTLAYQFTRKAPLNIKPAENVNIMFCSIECNRSMPLAEDRRSASFVQDMKDWSLLTNNIYVWDYVVQFQNFLCPFPNFDVLQPNIQLFKDHGVDLLFEQGSGSNWSDFEEWKFYLIAELSWNCHASVDSLQEKFFNAYYGPAAEPVSAYYKLVKDEMNLVKDSIFLDIYGFPVLYANSFLKPEKMERYMQLLDSAELLAAADSFYLRHVWKTRVSPDYAYVDLAINNRLGNVSFVEQKDGTKMISAGMLQKLDRLLELARATGIVHVNEKAYSLDEYKEYVLRKAELQTADNLLDKAKVSLLTPSSPVYEVGGVTALNDRRFGGLHFRYNWLGFQGEHFEVIVELPEKEDIHKISMNFLTDEISWVFLPDEVTVSISEDGEKYQELAVAVPEKANTRNRITSVPVVFETPGLSTRFVKVRAQSMLVCPSWHRGFGNPSWIFIDELVVQ